MNELGKQRKQGMSAPEILLSLIFFIVLFRYIPTMQLRKKKIKFRFQRSWKIREKDFYDSITHQEHK